MKWWKTNSGLLRPFIMFVVAPGLSLHYFINDNAAFFEGALSRGQTVGRDFAVFWGASAQLWRGDLASLFDPIAFSSAMNEIMGLDLTIMPFPYPPHSLLFVAPLALLPYTVALASWLAATFAFALALLRRSLALDWPVTVGFLLCPASIVNISTGQNGFLSAAFLCGGLLLLERRPLAAGLLLGLLSYKPQLGLLIPLLLICAGHWRAFWAASVTVVAMVTASLLLFGPELWQLFLTQSGPLQFSITQHLEGGFQQMSPTYFMAGRLLGFELWQAWALQACSSLFATAASIWAFRQNVPHALKAGVAMVAVVLVSPYILNYDLTIVAIAILAASSCFAATWWERAVGAMAWLLPGLILPSQAPIGPLILTALLIILLRRVAMLQRGQDRMTPRRDIPNGNIWLAGNAQS